MRPVVALLTDFGLHDHYVGVMKGVILGICREASLVDITHDVPPQDVLAGALELAASVRYFPAGTVFLAVVDPGVGSSRRAIAASAGPYHFVAPDNGLIGLAIGAAGGAAIVEIRDPRFALSPVSRTFEGRDRLAPAAAWLARGVDLAQLGPPVTDPQVVQLPSPTRSTRGLQGVVVRVDRFGNLVTNLDAAQVLRLRDRGEGAIVETPSGATGRVVSTYSEAQPGSLCGLIGSSGYLEVAVAQGDAALVTGLGRGAAIVLVERPDEVQERT